jgi:hypothetical protein
MSISIEQESVCLHPSTDWRIKHCRIRMCWVNSNIKQTCLSSITFCNWISNNKISNESKIVEMGNQPSIYYLWTENSERKRKMILFDLNILFVREYKLLWEFRFTMIWIKLRKWNYSFIWFAKVLTAILIWKSMKNILIFWCDSLPTFWLKVWRSLLTSVLLHIQ